MHFCEIDEHDHPEETTNFGMTVSLIIEIVSIINLIVYVSVVLQACFPAYYEKCWKDKPELE